MLSCASFCKAVTCLVPVLITVVKAHASPDGAVRKCSWSAGIRACCPVTPHETHWEGCRLQNVQNTCRSASLQHMCVYTHTHMLQPLHSVQFWCHVPAGIFFFCQFVFYYMYSMYCVYSEYCIHVWLLMHFHFPTGINKVLLLHM